MLLNKKGMTAKPVPISGALAGDEWLTSEPPMAGSLIFEGCSRVPVRRSGGNSFFRHLRHASAIGEDQSTEVTLRGDKAQPILKTPADVDRFPTGHPMSFLGLLHSLSLAFVLIGHSAGPQLAGIHTAVRAKAHPVQKGTWGGE